MTPSDFILTVIAVLLGSYIGMHCWAWDMDRRKPRAPTPVRVTPVSIGEIDSATPTKPVLIAPPAPQADVSDDDPDAPDEDAKVRSISSRRRGYFGGTREDARRRSR